MSARTWQIWPLIRKHSAPHALNTPPHGAKLKRHSAKYGGQKVQDVHSNSNLTLNKQGDLEIDQGTTLDQMQKLGLKLNIKEIIK